MIIQPVYHYDKEAKKSEQIGVIFSHIGTVETAQQSNEQEKQIEALRRFAENLLEETEDSPQTVVKILNNHFWDLV